MYIGRESNINMMQRDLACTHICMDKDKVRAGTGHHLHWDQQQGGQRGQALGEGA